MSYHTIANKKKGKNVLNEGLKKINQCSPFWLAKFKSNVQFRRPWPETLDNPGKLRISGLSRVSELN